MKKIIIVFVSGVLYTSLISNYANAQKTANISFAASKMSDNNISDEGKKASESIAIDPAGKSAIKEMEVNLKAAKANLKMTSHFNKHFKNVSNLRWNPEEKLVVATFTVDNKQTRVIYDKKGRWLYTIAILPEDQVPADVKSLVNDTYQGYTISLVKEVSQGDIILYYVQIENNTSFKDILVANDEITVYKEFQKSR